MASGYMGKLLFVNLNNRKIEEESISDDLARKFLGGYGVFSTPILYLSIDEDEVKHGTRREGMFIGMNALITKPALSLGPIVATLILVYYGYVQGSDNQSASALFGIKILFFLLPAIVLFISMIFIYFHPLYGERLEKMQKTVEEIHKKKVNDYKWKK